MFSFISFAIVFVFLNNILDVLLLLLLLDDIVSIYVEMIEREQSVVWLVMINVDGFVDVSLDMETNQTEERLLPIPPSSMCVLYEEKVTDSYIYVSLQKRILSLNGYCR